MSAPSLVLAIILCLAPLTQSEQCYATTPDPYRRMGQKSSYFINANLDDEEISEVVPYAVAMEVKGTMSEHHQDLTRALAECRIPTSASKTVERQLTPVR